jgi:hypothetical protein
MPSGLSISFWIVSYYLSVLYPLFKSLMILWLRGSGLGFIEKEANNSLWLKSRLKKAKLSYK